MSCGHSPRRVTLDYTSSCTARAPLRFCSATPGIGCRPHSSGTTSVPDGATRRRSRSPQHEGQQQQPSTTCPSCAKPRASSNCKSRGFGRLPAVTNISPGVPPLPLIPLTTRERLLEPRNRPLGSEPNLQARRQRELSEPIRRYPFYWIAADRPSEVKAAARQRPRVSERDARERIGRVSGRLDARMVHVCLPNFPRLTPQRSVFAVFLFRI